MSKSLSVALLLLVTAVAAVQADAAVTTFGPKTYTIPAEQELTFTETISVQSSMCTTDAAVYTLIVTNGRPDGTGRLKQGSLTLNGESILKHEIEPGVVTMERAIVLRATNSIVLKLKAPDDHPGEVTISIRRQITTPVLSEKTFTLSADQTGPFQESFTLPAGQPGPYTLLLVNGGGAGSPVDDAEVILNDSIVLSKADIENRGNQDIVQTLARTVSLQSENVLRLNLKSNKLPAQVRLRIVRPVSDTTGPTIRITNQQNEILTTAAANVAGSVEDVLGLGTFEINGTPFLTTAGGAFQQDIALNPGSNTITLDATDCAGNRAHAELVVLRDVAAPQVAITSPRDAAIFRSAAIEVGGTAADDIALASVVVNGQPATVAGGVWSAALVFNPSDGSRQIVAVATDRVGRQTTTSITITIDTVAPSITAESPASGSRLWSTSATVTGTITDAGTGVQSIQCGTSPGTVSGNAFTCSVTLDEGLNDLAITATDVAGNVASKVAHYNVTTDSQSPALTITAPANDSFTNVTAVEVTGTASDDQVLESVIVNGQTATVTGADWTAQLDFGSGTEGARTITVVAKDASGKQSTATATITIDITPPGITSAAAPPPNAGGWNNTFPTVTFACSDALSGIVTCTPPETSSEDGESPARGVAIDRAGNVTVLNVALKVDTTPPVIQPIASPDPSAEGWFWAPEVTVGFLCNDALSGVVTCTDPITFTNEGAGQVASGEAVDQAGNRATASLTVNADRTAPALSVIPPGEVVGTAQLTLQGTATDASSGISSVTCAGVAATLSGPSFTCTTPLTEGPNALTVIAMDRSGIESRVFLGFVRDTIAPTITLESPAAGTTTNGAAVTVTGSVIDIGGLNSFTVAGQPVSVTANAFTVNVPLTEGANEIAVVAMDRAGNRSSATATATRFSVPAVVIDSPADLALVRTTSVPVQGTVSAGVTSVLVNGIAATLTGNTFSAPGVPLAQGRTVITANASSVTGAVASASINIYRDSIPPRLDVYSPADGAIVFTPKISISGMVDDIVVGTINAGQVRVEVNGVPAEVANRAFLLSDIPLTEGSNTLLITATDQGGNSTVLSYRVTYAQPPAATHLEIVSGNGQRAAIGTMLPQPIVVRALQGANPVANHPITFNVLANDGLLTNGATSGRNITVVTNPQGEASIHWKLGTRAGAGNNRIEARGSGAVEFSAVGTTGQPHLIVVDSGDDQFGVVGANLPRPLVAVVVDAGSNRLEGVPVTFSVRSGGGNFGGQSSLVVHTDSDGRAIAAPVLGPLAGEDNHRFGASVAGLAAAADFNASGRIAGEAGETQISGVVLDNSSVPVAGVTVRIEGTTLTAQSDGAGQFLIKPAPVGYVKLIVDGSTAQRPGTWPSLEFSMFTLPGTDNNIGMPVYLLPVDVTRGLHVDETRGGTLTLPELPGFSLTVAPGSVTFPGGSRIGTVSVTLVHADKMPMTPGFGQQPRFIVTIQPPGAHFDPPAAITFPNVDGLAPGAVTEMYSFDHDLGQFVAIGTASISADGTTLRSDPGVGIIKGGWHCGGNPASPGTTASCPECQTCQGEDCAPNLAANGSGCTPENACSESAVCQGGNCVQVPKKCEDCLTCKNGVCSADSLQNAAACTNDDKCLINKRCLDGECTGDAVDLTNWKSDNSFGEEVKLPDSIKNGINSFINAIPGFEGGGVDETTFGLAGKVKHCCSPDEGYREFGIRESTAKFSMKITVPIPFYKLPKFDWGWDFGPFLAAFKADAVAKIITTPAFIAEGGRRADLCNDEQCLFGSLSVNLTFAGVVEAKVIACVITDGDDFCLTDVTFGGGITVRGAIGASYNKPACSSGGSGFWEVGKTSLVGYAKFNFLDLEWKVEAKHEFDTGWKGTF